MPAPSLRWLTLAVLLPLLLLAVLAALGTRAQLRVARAEARAEAERIAPGTAEWLRLGFEASMSTITSDPDPPLPGTPSPKDEILAGSDLEALARLRDDPAAGLSPAGLPRRTLAAFAIHRLDPSAPQNPAVLADLVTWDAPSILTSRALEELPVDDRPALIDRWKKEEAIRRLARTHRLNPENDRWIEQNGLPVYLRHNGDTLDYLEFPATDLSGFAGEGHIPLWTRAHLAFDAAPAPPGSVASAPIRPGHGLSLHISLIPDLIEAPIRRQQRWTLALLASAVLVAGLALLAIHRTLRRERQLHEMKSQFVASVSHELRAPVASIRLMADALEAEKVDPPTAKKFHRLIAREGARLSTLVANVLDHARIERGTREWRMEPCDLAPLVADTLRVMEPLAAEKNISFSTDLAPVEATVDAGAIQQALVNLLDNAIKFPPPGSTVHIALALDEAHRTWSLTVRDEGPGIPHGEHVRIFERFYRPGDELRRETQGAGIGLSLVKSITEAHRGAVLLDSEAGRGSAFTLRLPLSP